MASRSGRQVGTNWVHAGRDVHDVRRYVAEVFTCDIDPAGLATLPDGNMTWECDMSDSDALDAIFDEILPETLFPRS